MTIVAAVDAITDSVAKLHRNGMFRFDREIRDTTPCVEHIGGNNRPRRADVDAGSAGAAMRAGGVIGRQRQIGKELAEEKPRPRIPTQQIRVLPDPANAGLFRQRLLEYRRAIDERAVPERPDV